MPKVKVPEGCAPSAHCRGGCFLTLAASRLPLGVWPRHAVSVSVATGPLPSVSNLPLPLSHEDTTLD